MTMIRLTKTLHEVPITLHLEELLDQVSTSDLIEYVKESDDGAWISALAEAEASEVLEHLCNHMGNVDVARDALNGVDSSDVLALFEEFGFAKAWQPKVEVTAVEADGTNSQWVKVDGITHCLLTGVDVITRFGTLKGKSEPDAREMAVRYAIGAAHMLRVS